MRNQCEIFVEMQFKRRLQMKKKLVTTMLALTITATLIVGCGTKAEPVESTETTQEVTEEVEAVTVEPEATAEPEVTPEPEVPDIATEEATDEDIVAIADFVWSADLDTNWKRYSHTMNGVTVSMDISKSVPIDANEQAITIQPLTGEDSDISAITLFTFNPEEVSLEAVDNLFLSFMEKDYITTEIISEDESTEFCGTYADRSIYDVTNNSDDSHYKVEIYVIPYITNGTSMTLYICTCNADYPYSSFGENEEVAAGMFDHVFNSIRLSFNQEAVDEQGQTEAE